MFMQSRRDLLLALGGAGAAGAVIIVGTRFSLAEEASRPNNVGSDGLMLRGFDPVAYFTEGKPTEGDPAIQVVQDGLTWRFASAANRDAFLADPAKYRPAYGGYCAMGTALERKIDGDPEVWRIVDGKLYLNVNQDTQKYWEQDIPGRIEQADSNWPKIKDVPPDQLGG